MVVVGVTRRGIFGFCFAWQANEWPGGKKGNRQFCLGSFLAYNFIQMKFSENYLLGFFFKKFSKKKYSQKYHKTSSLSQNEIFTCPTPCQLLPLTLICYWKILSPPQNCGSFKRLPPHTGFGGGHHDYYYYHYINYRNFTLFSGVEILWIRTVSAKFQANRPNLCKNCAFPQNFHSRKLSEILVFCAVCLHLPF